ncbi:peroxisomal bifunctional enzyme [Capsaspora owczarzaki ATCC 30864]|uniref:Peroxisomal bifunctional enzyme n=1 Tax=Capsaspora owczarzaki (strain ATCC 30864) TaxID=595528 RepID=A0A0D2X5J3_CAPO3|nr:peroxisomal bifunctional enzyme [Capsaspora owczarzaki ATCC 30864]KJE97909.1 peroxisomal bifunctional enzyme [Capsaspora owczarzaki ATCC 30864]|eukprot:XP_004342583.1 peroxisomal bifunctional enzyme [Capsaspora owczarzaki ATCC 30864]
MAHVSITLRQSIAVLSISNPPVNTLNHAVRHGIVRSVREAISDARVQALVLVGAGRSFPAGADIKEFRGGQALNAPVLTEVCDVLEQSPKPIVAALHGTALGGGLELALGCHYRVALDSAHLGLPEVHLGILPGAGGTQRLPRLIGLQRALDLIVSGQHISAAAALKLGLIDQIFQAGAPAAAEGTLLDRAVEYAQGIASRPLDGRRVSELVPRDKSTFDQSDVWDKALATVKAQHRGYDAPIRIVEAVRAAAQLPFKQGMAKEYELVVNLMKGPQASALQHLFFAEREVGTVPGLNPSLAKPVRSVGVLGAGTMGAGIAMVFLNAKIPVVLLDTKQEFLDRGLAGIRAVYASDVKKGKLTEEALAKRLALLTPTLDYAAFANVDLAIEAVFENMDIKKQVFAKLDAVCKPEAILASNTSTLNIDEMAAATKRPEQFIGTHFFSPANVMRLLENVRGKKSSPSTIATVMALSKTIKKVGVLVGNCDGFVGNRMLEGYAREASFMLEEGALPAQVDKVLTSFGMAMGPFQMGDLAGNDVGWRIRQGKGMTNPATRPAKEGRYCELGDKLCELGRFGQKAGAGWYKYEQGQRKAIPDDAVAKLIEAHSSSKGIARRSISDEEIFERCMYPLINEGFKVLEEGIALRPGDIDIIWAYGYGFPRYRGGPMHVAQTIGLKKIYTALAKYSKQFPTSHHFVPSKLLQTLAETNTTLEQHLATKSKL